MPRHKVAAVEELGNFHDALAGPIAARPIRVYYLFWASVVKTT